MAQVEVRPGLLANSLRVKPEHGPFDVGRRIAAVEADRAVEVGAGLDRAGSREPSAGPPRRTSAGP